MIPFKYLLLRINETHMKALEVESREFEFLWISLWINFCVFMGAVNF